MFYNKKAITVASFVAFIVLGGTVLNSPVQKERNLKVLPRDISDEKLDSIMHVYNKALGVTCNFCHFKPPTLAFGSKDTLDFASDKEPMKENARDMMRMVIDMNSKYFYFDKNKKPEYLTTITCKMCHQGQAMPPDYH